MSRRLEGQRVIVTGASRGIGRAVAEAAADEGARLVVTATRAGHLDAAVVARPEAADLEGERAAEIGRGERGRQIGGIGGAVAHGAVVRDRPRERRERANERGGLVGEHQREVPGGVHGAQSTSLRQPPRSRR